MRFLDLGLGNTVTDAKTIWNYENTLANNEAGRQLFDMFLRNYCKKDISPEQARLLMQAS